MVQFIFFYSHSPDRLTGIILLVFRGTIGAAKSLLESCIFSCTTAACRLGPSSITSAPREPASSAQTTQVELSCRLEESDVHDTGSSRLKRALMYSFLARRGAPFWSHPLPAITHTLVKLARRHYWCSPPLQTALPSATRSSRHSRTDSSACRRTRPPKIQLSASARPTYFSG